MVKSFWMCYKIILGVQPLSQTICDVEEAIKIMKQKVYYEINDEYLFFKGFVRTMYSRGTYDDVPFFIFIGNYDENAGIEIFSNHKDPVASNQDHVIFITPFIEAITRFGERKPISQETIYYTATGNYFEHYGFDLTKRNLTDPLGSTPSSFSTIKRNSESGLLSEIDLKNNFSRFSWQDMEKIVGQLFQNMGYQVNVTGKSGDFGIDVEAKNQREYIGIQVKHWKSDVDFDTVAKTLGVSQKFTKTIIISTKSGFTSQAIQHQKNNSYVLELWDSSRFKQECRTRLIQESGEREYYNQGVDLANQSRPDEAIVQFDKALKINPNFKEALYNKATALNKLDRFAEALPIFDQVIKLDPHDYDAIYNKGGALLKLGKYDQCLPIFEDATIRNPEKAGAWYNKGAAWLMMNGLDDALYCYEQATRINPDYTEAWYLKGSTFHKLKKYSEALESYERALNLNPNHIEARHNMGNALVKLGKVSEAIECFDRVLEIDPNNKAAKESKKIAIEESSIKDIEESSVNKTTKITEDNPMKILKMRLAKGEITEEEFTRLKSLLE